jgi:glycosyltransferase involved in cell wall biosynthesis
MSRLRILLLAPNCNPAEVSIPFVTFSHAAALAELHDVSLVIGAPVEKPVRSAGANFHSIEVVNMPRLQRLFDWGLRRVFKYNYATQALTAFRYPFALAFEWYAWLQLRGRIFAGDFDVVLRLIPMSPVLPSPFAFFLRKGPIPFVLGPLNGGLPYVQNFSQTKNAKHWFSNLRWVYRFLPFARSTYRHAAAIIAASSQVCAEFARFHDKLFFIPEPGVSASLCSGERSERKPDTKTELIFVGGFIPCKACDLALRAVAPLLRSGLARFSLLGDGPERNSLEQLTKSLGIEKDVCFRGWVSHDEVFRSLRSADVMVFPSVRDNGAGAIFEALSCGAVPVVADFGGPGDIIYTDVGYKVPLTNEDDFVEEMTRVLTELATDRDHLERLQKQAMTYARERLTWDAKARDTTKVLNWVLGRGPRPDLLPPKILAAAVGASLERAASKVGSSV